jgi:hypothetical protein
MERRPISAGRPTVTMPRWPGRLRRHCGTWVSDSHGGFRRSDAETPRDVHSCGDDSLSRRKYSRVTRSKIIRSSRSRS